MNKKRIIMIALVALIALSGVFATRIGITYGETEYILNTSRPITGEDVAYFNGMYDAFGAIQEGRQLWEMYDIIRQKSFPDSADPNLAKQDYLEAFIDCMTNYSYGTEGNFQDIYPIYVSLMASPASYANAVDIAYFGAARFYPANI